MVGIIRRGRSEVVKRKLLLALAEAWTSITGEPIDRAALFLYEIPGYQAMEMEVLLPEASEDSKQQSESQVA